MTNTQNNTNEIKKTPDQVNPSHAPQQGQGAVKPEQKPEQQPQQK